MQRRLHALLRDDTEGDNLIICKQNIFLPLPLLCATKWAVSSCHLLSLCNSLVFLLSELYFVQLYLAYLSVFSL